ncbi:MAG: hypothetical protein PHH98_01915 [Candidatus Gracilibacteria bacterium]|nr:hypothetical protein [Candidatus Gracilibacteria bacterium]
MSLSYPDVFACLEQEKLLVEPLFSSDLNCGHFEPMGQDFINWLLFSLNIDDGVNYPYLRKKLDKYIKHFNNNIRIDYNYFLKEIKDILLGKNEEIKKEFYNYVSSMELSLNFDKTKGMVRRILGIRNGIDFAQYNKGISGVSENTLVNGLIRGGLKENENDKVKTLGDELNEDIKIISLRVNELLGKQAILNNGIIIDDNVGLFSALDGFNGGEVFLTIDGKVIDSKPPKGKWTDGNESKELVFEVGGDIIPF